MLGSENIFPNRQLDGDTYYCTFLHVPIIKNTEQFHIISVFSSIKYNDLVSYCH